MIETKYLIALYIFKLYDLIFIQLFTLLGVKMTFFQKVDLKHLEHETTPKIFFKRQSRVRNMQWY